MPNIFAILAGFLERSGDEVQGREMQSVPEETRLKLRDFARGELAAAEQTRFIEELNKNPDLVAALAAEVKAMRGGPAQRGQV
jgi:hypothetical protein